MMRRHLGEFSLIEGGLVRHGAWLYPVDDVTD